jgi:protein TonB
MNAAPDENNIKGANEYVPPARRVAQADISDEQYYALLVKQINQHTVYPDEWKRTRLQGSTRVSFTILPNGDLHQESLKVVTSSGQSSIDARALDTIRTSAPFPAPQREMTIAITVRFGETR